MDNKLYIQSFSAGQVRLLLFIFLVITGVSITLIYDNKRHARAVDKKPLTYKVIFPKSLPQKHSANNTEHSLPSPDRSPISGRKAERLLHPIVIQAAGRYQVDPALIKAIIMAESGYNTRAISKKGAKGLMQLMPATARALGVEDVFNPRQNISGGVRYFKQLVNQFDGDIKLALAAYNAGSRKVRHYQGIPPFKATRCYIKKVFKYHQIYKVQMGRA
jgi:soluble lytic murein transglycosylase-like protein